MKNKKIIIVTIILVIICIYIMYVNVPRLFQTKNAEIIITDPPPLTDIDLYGGGVGIFKRLYQGVQPTHIMVYSNGVVVEKDYSTWNFVNLPDFFEKTETIKFIAKISKEDVKQIKDKLTRECKEYDSMKDFKIDINNFLESYQLFEDYKTQERIELRYNNNTYVFDEVAKEILETYDINIYLNNRY